MNRYPTKLLTFLFSLLLFSAGLCRAQTFTGVVNSYYKVTAINVATSTLTLNTAAGLTPNTKVLLIQMKGAAIDVTNTAAFGNITAINNTGNYEVNYVCSVAGNTVLLRFALLKSYTVAGLVQLVTIPRYTDATVTGTVTPLAWDPVTGTGGVVALEGTNSLTLQASIDASGAGFRGGTYIDFPIPPNDCNFATDVTDYAIPNPTVNAFINGGRKGEGIAIGSASYELGRGKLANGGGGANNHNSGGAGGGNYGSGGIGGQRSNEGAFNCHGTNPGIGGLSLQTNGYSAGANKIFMGGGGGSGQGNNDVGMHGGHGGGIVLIITNNLIGNNNLITASGARPFRAGLADPFSAGGDGGGGAGAGGVVILEANNYTGNVQVQAMGGRGSDASYTPSSGCFGPGGGGGGGVIWVKGAVNPLLTTNVTGGTNGLISVTTSVVACRGLANGASPGNNGAIIPNYSLPLASTPLCIPLAVNELIYFKGQSKNLAIELSWKMNSVDLIKSFTLERSFDQNNFTAIAALNKNQNVSYSYSDEDAVYGFNYYRLKVHYLDGRVAYSNIISVEKFGNNGIELVTVKPNPVHQVAALQIESNLPQEVVVSIYNANGQQLISVRKILKRGLNNVTLDVMKLSAGTYFLRVSNPTRTLVTSITKAE